jgi:hypothetical protein
LFLNNNDLFSKNLINKITTASNLYIKKGKWPMKKNHALVASVVAFFVVILLSFWMKTPQVVQASFNKSEVVPVTPSAINQQQVAEPMTQEYGTPETTRRAKRYAAVSQNPAYPTLESRLAALQQRYPSKEFNPDEVLDLLAEPNAWRNETEVPKDLPLSQEDLHDGREFIHFDSSRLDVLLPGDSLDLPVTQLGTRLKMIVSTIEDLPNGGSTWSGDIEGFNDSFHANITHSENLTLGGFDTPQGHYAFQVNGKEGWVASSEKLFKRDPNVTDALIPPNEDQIHGESHAH